jgi:hypothetical protein
VIKSKVRRFWLDDADKAEAEAQIEKYSAEITEITQKLDEVQAEQLESSRAILRVSKNAERYLTKRQTLVARRDECNNSIRELGVLPEEAYNKYTETRPDKVSSLTHSVCHYGLELSGSSSNACTRSMKHSRSSHTSTRRLSSSITISPNSEMSCWLVAVNWILPQRVFKSLSKLWISEKTRRSNGLSSRFRAISKRCLRPWYRQEGEGSSSRRR